jgi:hypothetical protein
MYNKPEKVIYKSKHCNTREDWIILGNNLLEWNPEIIFSEDEKAAFKLFSDVFEDKIKYNRCREDLKNNLDVLSSTTNVVEEKLNILHNSLESSIIKFEEANEMLGCCGNGNLTRSVQCSEWIKARQNDRDNELLKEKIKIAAPVIGLFLIALSIGLGLGFGLGR